MWSKSLLRCLLILSNIIFLHSCESINSSSFDEEQYGTDNNISDPQLAKAYNIIRRECIDCHTNKHDEWISYKTNEAWENSGLVVAGNAANSLLIERMINTPESETSELRNMPQGGSPIDAQDYQALRDWIDNI